MLKKAPYFIILLIIAAVACTKKVKQDLKKSEKFTNGKPIEYEIEANEKFADIAVYSKMQPYLDSIAPHYDTVYYFCALDTNFLFYVANGKKRGVVDKTGKVIVPVEYKKVFNPGGTLAGFIEVENNGKFGLYDFTGNTVLEAKYQGIYPAKFDGVLVQVKLDGKFGLIKEDGTEVMNTDGYENPDAFKSPYITQAALKWSFNINDENILFLQPTGFKQYENDPIEGRAVVYTPSYLLELGFLPEMTQGIAMDKETDFGVAESKGKVVEVSSLWDGIWAAFTEYYEVGLDARGYETNKNNLVTLDANGKVVSSIEYYTPYMPQSPCGGNEGLFNTRFIDSSLFEIMTYQYAYESKSKDTTYDTYPEYLYYGVDTTGKVSELASNRRFAFTQFVKIDDNYLKGCFASFVPDPQGNGNAVTRNHLSVEDLEVMKNEIFADYGLIFKKPKWQKYFAAQKWYQPHIDNVNHLLTEVDKHNIAFITATIEKMQANPNEYNKNSEGYIPILP